MATEFKEKDEVLVGPLKKLGTILGSSKAGWYDVLVGGKRIQCRASDLKPREELSKSLLKSLKQIAKPSAADWKSPPRFPMKVDLHGMTVEDAMRSVEKSVDRAIIDGYEKMEIVHGIGSGKIRQALHRYLAQLSVIESYRLDEQNPGVTWVYF